MYDDTTAAKRTVSDLITSDIGLSYSHLSRLFSREEGRTIKAFYRVQRMERARHLLVTTKEQVAIIADRLNYGSSARFAAAFRKETGMSPTAFRERRHFITRPLDEL